MNNQEAAALLAIAAAFDNRKPDPDAATAWAIALEGADFDDCRTAIVAYYRSSKEWLMPSDVISGVVAIRRKRIDDYGLITPPDDLDPDDPNAYTLWYSTTMKAIASGQIVRSTEPTEELPRRDLRELGINDGAERGGFPQRVGPTS